jgi:hypothetical protein
MKNPGSALRVKTILFLSRVRKMNEQESPDPCDPIFEPQMNKNCHLRQMVGIEITARNFQRHPFLFLPGF